MMPSTILLGHNYIRQVAHVAAHDTLHVPAVFIPVNPDIPFTSRTTFPI